MEGFVGRRHDLEQLSQLLTPGRRSAPGMAVLLRGRRGVGKTRLVQALIEETGAPAVFFTASGQPNARELQLFADAVAESTFPDKADFGDTPATWEDALRRLAQIAPESPSIIVLDEVPYLMAGNPHFEGTLQKVFDRHLRRKPVLLVVVGSNTAVMAAMDAHDRPFHGRAIPLEVHPLNPADIAEYRSRGAVDAIDAWALTGGMPLLLTEWDTSVGVADHLREALASPLSSLVVSGERAVAAEYAVGSDARLVVHELGSRRVGFTKLASRTGVASTSLNRVLGNLVAAGAVCAEKPYSAKASSLALYRVADASVAFWLDFVAPHQGEIDRRRGDLTASRAIAAWPAWRGRIVEPLIRESLMRWSPLGDDGGPVHVGSYWNRTFSVEVDLVGGDRFPVARHLAFVGSVKWRENPGFTGADVAALHAARLDVPGAQDVPLVAVTPHPVDVPADVHNVTADDLVAAWA